MPRCILSGTEGVSEAGARTRNPERAQRVEGSPGLSRYAGVTEAQPSKSPQAKPEVAACEGTAAHCCPDTDLHISRLAFRSSFRHSFKS
ncbi:MAG TPA: hypothetical protein VNB54_02960, partial [Alphaproteobacteria bacterium]|nr:hypothetical protein [Alphaproteobacteria bacterium]